MVRRKKMEMIEDASTKSKMQYGLQKRNCRLRSSRIDTKWNIEKSIKFLFARE